MKTTAKLFLIGAAAMVAAVPALRAAQAEVGKAAPNFTLTDINGQKHSLSDYKGKIVVLEWVNPECPIVMKHYEKSGNMPKLQKEAASEGVVWLSINSGHPGAQGDFNKEEVGAWLKKNGAAPAAYVRDQDGRVGRLYGATNTPHLYVINQDGMLAYAGGIDSIPSENPADIAKATNYVAAALADLKAGRSVGKTHGKVYGCSVKYGRDT